MDLNELKINSVILILQHEAILRGGMNAKLRPHRKKQWPTEADFIQAAQIDVNVLCTHI